MRELASAGRVPSRTNADPLSFTGPNLLVSGCMTSGQLCLPLGSSQHTSPRPDLISSNSGFFCFVCPCPRCLSLPPHPCQHSCLCSWSQASGCLLLLSNGLALLTTTEGADSPYRLSLRWRSVLLTRLPLVRIVVRVISWGPILCCSADLFWKCLVLWFWV